MKKTEYRFTVTELQHGQAQPYADTIYAYEVESNALTREVLNFCKSVLFGHGDTKPDKATWEKCNDDPSVYFGGYYEFIPNGRSCRHTYRVVVPYTD